MIEILPISTIIPVCNRPKLVREAIFSVAQGKAWPHELIIVLSPLQSTNASFTYPDQDAVQTALAEVKRKSVQSQAREIQTKIIHCKHPYVAAARNIGVTQAQNSWLAFLDSDDLWHPDKLIKQWQFLIKRPHLKACHTAEEWIKLGRKLFVPAHLRPRTGRFLQAAFSHCLISNSALLIRKDSFQKYGGFDESLEVCEDFSFFLYYLKDNPIGLVDEKLTIKRSGNWPQLSAKYHSLDALRIQAILKFMKTFDKELQTQQKSATIKAARLAVGKKLNILIQGAQKRKNSYSLEKYTSLKKEATLLMNRLKGTK